MFAPQWSWQPPQLFLDFLHFGALHFLTLPQQSFPQPLLQPLSQQVFGAQQEAGAAQEGLQPLSQQWSWQQSPQPLLFLHFLAFPQPLLQQSVGQHFGAQQVLAAGAQQVAAAGAQQLAGAGAQQLAAAGAQQLAGAQQVVGQQLERLKKPKAFASELAARLIKAAAVNVIHFMSVFS